MVELGFIEKSRLEKLASDMCDEMERGLSGGKSSLLMLPTYIHRLPSGSESGNFLALGKLQCSLHSRILELLCENFQCRLIFILKKYNLISQILGDRLSGLY